MTNDPEAKVLRVTHVNKKVKLDWKQPVRKVERLEPVLDNDGKQQTLTVDDQTMKFNYDALPSYPLHVNCRCSILPIRS